MDIHVNLTFNPDDGDPQDCTVIMNDELFLEMAPKIGTPDWVNSLTVMKAPMKMDSGVYEDKMFRLSRISAMERVENP